MFEVSNKHSASLLPDHRFQEGLIVLRRNKDRVHNPDRHKLIRLGGKSAEFSLQFCWKYSLPRQMSG